MNKVIEALALEAGMQKTSLHYGRRDPYVLWENDIGAFAQLIIDKCAEQVNALRVPHGNEEVEYALFTAERKIRELGV